MKTKGNYTCEICGATFETNVKIAAHVGGHQRSIPADRIITELRRVADEKGRAPTQAEVDEETAFTVGAVESTFGSWEDGLCEIGLEPLDHSYSDDELICELQRVADKLGHSPSVAEMRTHGTVATGTIEQRFGSWNEGLNEAGIATTQSTKASPQDVLTAIQTLADELGHPPTAPEMEAHGDYSTKIAQRRFQSWNNALEKAGFNPHARHGISEEELQRALTELYDTLGHVPTSVEMEEYGQYTISPYIRTYGSWEHAIEAAGFEYPGRPCGSDHPAWKGGYEDRSYGPNWQTQRERVLERDDFECQMPGCSIDRKAHQKRWDRDLNIHHIMPISTFIDDDGKLDHERANRCENLVTLCQRHHQVWERFVPLQPDIR